MTLWQILMLHCGLFAGSTLLLGGTVVVRNALVKFAIPSIKEKLKQLSQPAAPTSRQSPMMPGHTQRLTRFGKISEKAA